MVFGIGAGKIEVFLTKQSYLPGEEAEGKIILNLKKPIKARMLKIGLYSYSRPAISLGNSRKGNSSTHNLIHEIQLLGEKKYESEEFEFKFPIPLRLQFQSGVLGQIEAFSAKISQKSYYLKTTLDLPMAFDINKTTPLVINENQ